MSSGEYERITVHANDGGRHTLAARYVQLCEAAADLVGYDVLERTRQGSYTGTVSASGGTHDAGGALDLSIKGLSASEVDALVEYLRLYGCAAWHRTPDQGDWGPHVHAIDSGANDLSPQAAHQVSEYEAGRNGLASGGSDDGPDIRPLVPYQWQEDPMEWTEKLPATAFSSGVKESLGDDDPDRDQEAGDLQVNTAARLQRLEETTNRIARHLGLSPAGSDTD